MNKLTVTNLFIYPIKSTFRIPLEESKVAYDGLEHDRSFAIINNNDKVITGRENQDLFKIKTKVENDHLIFIADEQDKYELSFLKKEEQSKEVLIFTDRIDVKLINDEVNAWISKTIGEASQLVRIDETKRRKMKPKYNGKDGDFIDFKDASAIHLISEASIKELNKNLDEPVTIHHFRPNIVIKGDEAYSEDLWKKVIIGECEFEVAVKTARGPMITIDQDTREKNKTQEPLKT